MYRAILEEIAVEIMNSKDQYQNNYGLYSGLTGFALFFHEYAKIDKSHIPNVDILIDEIFSSIENSEPYATYCAGIAGACLGIDFIYRGHTDAVEEPFAFIDEEINDYLNSAYTEAIRNRNFDFLHGATGMAFYYLDRLRSNQEEYRHHLDLLFQALENHAVREDNTIKWQQKERKGSFYNISLSHGMSSIILLLSELLEITVLNKVSVKELLAGAVNYILTQEIDPVRHGSYFPYASKEADTRGSRLAWCYGDLGIGLALLKASKALADEQLQYKAFEIFDFCAGRRDLSKNLVLDAGICHGTAGIALIYHDLYLRTQNERYQETAQYWLEQTARLYQEEKIFYLVDDDRYDSKRMSLLEGKAGIGLAILNIHFNVKTRWQRLLLL